jgi:hypothetical protein
VPQYLAIHDFPKSKRFRSFTATDGLFQDRKRDAGVWAAGYVDSRAACAIRQSLGPAARGVSHYIAQLSAECGYTLETNVFYRG